MADWDDVVRLTSRMPEMSERRGGNAGTGNRQWVVKEKLVVWERPLRKADIEALGDSVPDPPILAAWVPDEFAKEALVSDPSGAYFTTPHFKGWDIVLVALDRIPVTELEELIVEAWLRQAPKRLARAYLESTDAIEEEG